MSWVSDTLADFIAWLNLTPPADDATATRALTVALAAVETWLDRPLELAERTQEDFGLMERILLRAWPVESVSLITHDDGDDTEIDLELVHLDKQTGRLRMPTLYGTVRTTYTGGFATMPAELEFALWQVAAVLYPAMKSAAGASSGAQVSRVSTPDVGTVEFRSSSAGGGAPADSILGATLSPSIEALLQRYRAESVLGGA